MPKTRRSRSTLRHSNATLKWQYAVKAIDFMLVMMLAAVAGQLAVIESKSYDMDCEKI